MSDTTNISGDIGRNGNSKAIQWPAELELRDYFAAKAIQALAREISEQAQVCQVECNSTFAAALDATIGEYVRRAYKIADAMLKARRK